MFNSCSLGPNTTLFDPLSRFSILFKNLDFEFLFLALTQLYLTHRVVFPYYLKIQILNLVLGPYTTLIDPMHIFSSFLHNFKFRFTSLYLFAFLQNPQRSYYFFFCFPYFYHRCVQNKYFYFTIPFSFLVLLENEEVAPIIDP